MPVPLPSPSDTEFGPPNEREVQGLARGIVAVVCGDQAPNALQDLVLRVFFDTLADSETEIDLATPPFDLAEFARALARRDESFRNDVMHVLMAAACVQRPPKPEVLRRVQRCISELELDPALLDTHLERDVLLEAAVGFGFARDLHFPAPLSPSEHIDVGRHIPADRTIDLSQFPTDTLGRRVFELRQARGYAASSPQSERHRYAYQLDWVRVLADYGTSLESELEIAAFIAGASDGAESLHAFAIVAAHYKQCTGGRDSLEPNSSARSIQSRKHLAVRVRSAARRGASCPQPIELTTFNWEPYANMRVEDAHEFFGILANTNAAKRSGSAGPFAAGGITAHQREAGRHTADREQRAYKAYGATVAWRERSLGRDSDLGTQTPMFSNPRTLPFAQPAFVTPAFRQPPPSAVANQHIAQPSAIVADPPAQDPAAKDPAAADLAAATSTAQPSSKSIGQAAARTSFVTALSRTMGFGRVLVISAVLGTTYLGNTFQSSNSVSNILFELLAAGGLSAVIVPALVRNAQSDVDTERLANGVLGVATIVLGCIAAIGVVCAPWIAGVLATGVPKAQEAQQRALSTFLLRLFIPQIVLYGFGAIATAALHSRRKFASAAAAPIANTVIMVVAFAIFRWHTGANPGLGIDTFSRYLLAIAGTGGVLAFVIALGIPLWRSGIRLRPQLRIHDRDVRALLAHSGWGILLNSIGGLLAGALVIAGNVVQGGVVAFDVAFVLFLAPYAILAQPLETASAPALAEAVSADDDEQFAHTLHWTIESMCGFVAPLTAIIIVFARPGMLALGLGIGARGDGLVAAALAGLAIGLVPYSIFLIVARAFYALDDSRTPALVSLLCGAVGVVAILIGRLVVHERALIGTLGIAHTMAFVTGAVVLGYRLWRQTGHSPVTARSLIPIALATTIGAGVWMGSRRFDTGSRWHLVGVCTIGTVVFLIVYIATLHTSGYGSLRELRRGARRA